MPAPAATPTPSFRALTPEILATLQAAADASGNADLPLPADTAAWAEKLLRYCEINQATLRRRAREKWGTRAPETAGRIANFFAACHRATGDLRHLNAALKLADAPWTTPPASLPPRLAAELDALEKHQGAAFPAADPPAVS